MLQGEARMTENSPPSIETLPVVRGNDPENRDAIGFDRVLLRPQLVGELRWVRATYRSLRGPVRSRWRCASDRCSRWSSAYA